MLHHLLSDFTKMKQERKNKMTDENVVRIITKEDAQNFDKTIEAMRKRDDCDDRDDPKPIAYWKCYDCGERIDVEWEDDAKTITMFPTEHCNKCGGIFHNLWWDFDENPFDKMKIIYKGDFKMEVTKRTSGQDDHENNKKFKLCYIEESFAYFTTLDVKDQWGDGWKRASYEHNSSLPYLHGNQSENGDYEIRKLAFEVTEMVTPNDRGSFSVEEINAGLIPWLSSPTYSNANEAIPAGITFDEFIEAIHANGGKVYVPLGN